jgi:heme-degrading monooxygenase HmoA
VGRASQSPVRSADGFRRHEAPFRRAVGLLAYADGFLKMGVFKEVVLFADTDRTVVEVVSASPTAAARLLGHGSQRRWASDG